MPTVYYYPDASSGAQHIPVDDRESLLEALLRAGVDVSFGCRSGVCQSCMLRSPDSPPANAQRGLKTSQVEQGLFLSCCCHPDDGLRVFPVDLAKQSSQAKVIEKKALTDDVFRLRIEKVMDYRSGQFMTLRNRHKVARSYSTASLPQHDDYIEFHIKRIKNGAFSDWAWQHLNENDTLQVAGPFGNCFYTQTQPSQNIFLSGIGTGLAPLYGIARDALATGYADTISLFLGGNVSSSFYLIDELAALSAQHENFHVTLIAQKADKTDFPDNIRFLEGDIYETVRAAFPSFSDMRVLLCGADTFVRKMKKQCFLAGASMKDIAADPFIAFGN